MRLFATGALVAFLGICFSIYALVSRAHATLTLDSSVSVGETYSNNLYFTFANKHDDFGTFVKPRLTLKYASEDIVVNGTYTATGQMWVNNPGANTIVQGARFRFDLPFLTRRYKRLEVNLHENFNITPQLPAFVSVADDQSTGTGLGNIRRVGGGFQGSQGGAGFGANSLGNQGIMTRRSTSAYQNRAGFGLTYHLTPTLSPTLEYANNIRKFTSSQFQGSTTHRVNLQIEKKVNPQFGVHLAYKFQDTQFDSNGPSTTSIAVGGRGSGISHSLRSGINYQVDPTLPIYAQAGVTYTNTERRSERINFTGIARVAKNFSDGVINLNFRQRIGSGGGLAAATTLSQTVFLSGNKIVTQYVSLFGGFGFARNTSLSGGTIDLRTYQGNGGISVTLLSWLNGVASYAYQNQDSTGTAGNSAQSHSVFVGLSGVAPSWRIFK